MSRRKSTQAILDGRVKVNGRIETYPRLDVTPESSEILLDGSRLSFSGEEKVVYLVNKPIGYLSAMSDDRGRKTLTDLIDGKIKERVFHVGRLDQDSCGLILMTNDGDLANLVSHPASEIEKTYVAGVKGILDDRDLQAVKIGVTLNDGFKTSPAKIRLLRSEGNFSKYSITIYEGHKREIREIFKVFNKPVVSLVRVSIGTLSISLVPNPGDVKRLSRKEIDLLSKGAQKRTPRKGNNL
ncbi:pseudouridine synthase [Mesotoga sp.]|jgi:23S rRNA pseudouridine2605 synthase|uniref:pseudouridine synthase n=1 Tax=Mesotoga sp. TaxID=2053577 RepID=UPI00345F00AE